MERIVRLEFYFFFLFFFSSISSDWKNARKRERVRHSRFFFFNRSKDEDKAITIISLPGKILR